jgi:hypothetical protein
VQENPLSTAPFGVAAPDPGPSDSVAADLPPVVRLIERLLEELPTQAEILDCRLLPHDDQYAIFLQILGEVGKGVILPRRMLERALEDPMARARVRNLLRAAVEVLRSRRAVNEARLTAYFTALNVRSLPGPRCTSCEGPLLADDAVVVRDGTRSHIACPPAW